MWVETSEFLTEESYNVYYEKGGLAYGHWSDKEAECMDAAMLHPLMLVASDGIPFVDGLAHPRGAGTFSRFLGQYVSSIGRCCSFPGGHNLVAFGHRSDGAGRDWLSASARCAKKACSAGAMPCANALSGQRNAWRGSAQPC